MKVDEPVKIVISGIRIQQRAAPLSALLLGGRRSIIRVSLVCSYDAIALPLR